MQKAVVLITNALGSEIIPSPSQPPQKSITFSDDIVIIFAYSAKKNRANKNPEYSTLYPATNSASASGKSNGARFVSARLAMKKITARGR